MKKYKLNEIKAIFEKAKTQGYYSLYEVYKQPSWRKIEAYENIFKYHMNKLINDAYENIDYYITYANCQHFGIIYKATTKDNKTIYTYYTGYNVIEVIE